MRIILAQIQIQLYKHINKSYALILFGFRMNDTYLRLILINLTVVLPYIQWRIYKCPLPVPLTLNLFTAANVNIYINNDCLNIVYVYVSYSGNNLNYLN